MDPTTQPQYVSLRRAALQLGVPIVWLRQEADEDRVPFLRVGRRRLFDVEIVGDALAARSCMSILPDVGPLGGSVPMA